MTDLSTLPWAAVRQGCDGMPRRSRCSRAAGWTLGSVLVGCLAAQTLSGEEWLRRGTAVERGGPTPSRPVGEAAADPSGKGGADAGKHVLDPVLDFARDGLAHIRKDVRDYTATLVKRERISGRLTEHQYLSVKIRHEQVENNRVVVPFSVYLRFLGPRSVEGREVIWVEGRNNGKLIAHERGLKNLFRVSLDPAGFVARMGNRYPITEIGILNLIEQLIQRGEQDRRRGPCEVQFQRGALVDQRRCTMIEVTHPRRQGGFEFFRARILIDEQLNVPIHYAAWTWPERAGEQPLLEEEYTYRDVRLNVGLADRDFDPDNPEYNFP